MLLRCPCTSNWISQCFFFTVVRMLGGLYRQPWESRYNVRGTLSLGGGGVSYFTLSQTPSVFSRSVTTGHHSLVPRGQGYTVKTLLSFLSVAVSDFLNSLGSQCLPYPAFLMCPAQQGRPLGDPAPVPAWLPQLGASAGLLQQRCQASLVPGLGGAWVSAFLMRSQVLPLGLSQSLGRLCPSSFQSWHQAEAPAGA